MATVTAYTAARMKEIEDNAVVDGAVVLDRLILTRHDGTQIDAGNVRGPKGDKGDEGTVEEAPTDGVLYVRTNGAWAPSLTESAPSDGNKYALNNGAWVRTDRPWSLSFTNAGPTPPAGFVVGDVKVSEGWEARFQGSGYQVQYSLKFTIVGSSLSNTPRFQFPTSLRPVLRETNVAYILDPRVNSVANGTALSFLESNGQLTLPRGGSAVLSQSEYNGTATNTNFVGGLNHDIVVYISGSFTRNSDALPNTASYV